MQARDSKGNFTNSYNGSPCVHTQRNLFTREDLIKPNKIDDDKVILSKDDEKARKKDYYDYKKKGYNDNKEIETKEEMPRQQQQFSNNNNTDNYCVALLTRLAMLIKGVEDNGRIED